MATVLPFKGLRYNPDKIEDISKVITPPYDVISENERDDYYKLHPNNIIRLILSKELPGDDQSNNKYTRSGESFDTWRKEEVLKEEAEPAIYIYAQEFTLSGKKYIRRGFISLVKLEDFETGEIYPHEHTLSKPKEDRMNLMKATNANLSQVFTFFEDEGSKISNFLHKVSEGDPGSGVTHDIDFTDIYGVRNSLWPIKDKAIINELILQMKDRALFIADGHHRYETALFYRDFVNGSDKEQSSNGDSPSDYIMMMCVSMEDPGLQILPTHRLARNILDLDPEKIKNALNEIFDISDLGSDCKAETLTQKLSEDAHKHKIAMYIGESENKLYILTLRDKKLLDPILTDEYSEWKTIDTGILHGVIFDRVLGIQARNISKSESVKYVQGIEDSVRKVNEGEFQIAFFLNPTKIGQIRDIATKRHKMPPKATYFYPKLMTGMVIRHISDTW
ncbi:hypothetical protein SCALIN_C28_0010 [Candidatus Scalindua japonica]|uniref:DUF1015 domain-containing protein n=1 Tax=Candidatus Scalindua japonica TaxID=1284222 RepID=A0A286U110_9BACT|nr:DUF1015 domain-containing protein [Candidatus Scalindua japonica]GAX61808.1 hypothetical protein SCALIN_C28_0010 [Candidatus Scalindua japonica]